MYRTKDWKNPHKLKKGQIGITDPFETRVLLLNAFEAGADAMLEGLRKEGMPDGEGGVYKLTHWLKPEKAKFETSFIPDEE